MADCFLVSWIHRQCIVWSGLKWLAELNGGIALEPIAKSEERKAVKSNALLQKAKGRPKNLICQAQA